MSYWQKWYDRRSQKYKKRKSRLVHARRMRLQAWLDEYKTIRGCEKCGELHPRCLEFHHVRGKKIGNVADLVSRGWSVERLLTEITKCVILCANCHRKQGVA